MMTTPSQNNNQLAGSADRIPKANGHPDLKPARLDVIRHFAEETVKAKDHLLEIARRVMRAKPARYWADRCRAFMLAKNRVERSHLGKHRAPPAE